MDLWLIGGSICQGYMCILLYVKLIGCNGFAYIYAWLEEGVGSVCHAYMCILLYVKPIGCNGVAEMYAWLEEGGVMVLHRLLVSCRGCMLLYMKLIWYSGFPEIYAWLEEGGLGQSVMGIGALCYIWHLFGVMVLQRSMLNWRRGVWVNLPWVYVHCAIYETSVVYWFSRDLCLIGGGGGVNLPWVYLHCVISETYLVSWFSRDLCSIGGGGGINLPWVYVHCAISETDLSVHIHIWSQCALHLKILPSCLLHLNWVVYLNLNTSSANINSFWVWVSVCTSSEKLTK